MMNEFPDEISSDIVDHTSRGGEIFVKEFFYKHYDTSRHKLFLFFRNESVVVFDGNRVQQGRDNINHFFSNLLPPSSHRIFSIDSQPVMSSFPPDNLSVVATGTVSFGGQTPRSFVETFILAPDPDKPRGTYFVLSDVFRFFEPLS
eukprot:gnl/Trimastix_PCT/2498.p1 GENE.gnl/Trimastix_PCT/2498~~gnl/Trimastix_PCT/2498.p1  ORF type:complete len:157 (-),score=25.24 gnl/Trimastix_PCT/2498:165-602(-)